MEIRILDQIQNMRSPVGDTVMCLITSLGNAGWIWIALAAVLLAFPKTRRTGCVVAAALIFDLILCNVILKNLVARTRPFDINTAVELIVKRPMDFSFPSGHTAASFAAIGALFLAGQKKMGTVALVLGILIAFSRLYLYVHFPTDILGGIVVGLLAGFCGNACVKICEKKVRKKEKC